MLFAHWTAWLGQTQGHNTRVCCVVLFIASLLLPVSFSLFTSLLLTAMFSASCRFCDIFHFIEGCCWSWNSAEYSKSPPDVSFWSPAWWVDVTCHRPLVSPQWLTTLSLKLPTDCCWLTNQQLSTTNLCCGPSRLTAFCVTVIELCRWIGDSMELATLFCCNHGFLDGCYFAGVCVTLYIHACLRDL